MTSDHLMLAPDRMADVIRFLSECHRIDVPQLENICSILRRLPKFDFEVIQLGLCAMEKGHGEFIHFLRFSSNCLAYRHRCDESRSIQDDCSAGISSAFPLPSRRLSCSPSRFAQLHSTESGYLFCQKSSGGLSHASCLMILGSPTAVLSEPDQTMVELVVPTLLQMIEGLGELENLHGRLTAREREVLRWVAAGKSNWEIGRILNISERTAKFHVSNILAKLGLNNRVQAAALAAALPGANKQENS